MNHNPTLQYRRSIRYKGYDYTQPGAYFITLVTSDHQALFGEIACGEMQLSKLGNLIRSVWLRLPRFFSIQHDEWVIMPNHFHGIVLILDQDGGRGEASASKISCRALSPLADASPSQRPIGTKGGSLGAIIQNFKSVSTRKINQWLREEDQGEAFAGKGSGIARLPMSNASPLQVWQRNYYDRVIQNEKELDRIRQYIIDNPRKWAEDEEYSALD
jgi:putative transposase